MNTVYKKKQINEKAKMPMKLSEREKKAIELK